MSIVRDTSASLSILKKSALPVGNKVYTSEHVVVWGFGGTAGVPLCKVYLRTDFFFFYLDQSS